MTAPLRIAVLLPHLLDSNGDAANGRVLAARARWAGVEVARVDLVEDDDLSIRPDVLVVGTGADQDLPEALRLITRNAPRIAGWRADGSWIVAVGAGWEMLGQGIETAEGFVRGAGLHPGRSSAGTVRATGDIAVDSAHGLLIGFENHARRLSDLPSDAALGRVLAGTGNGDGTEGYLADGLLGTHLHGPVLAKNPRLADLVLGEAVRRTGVAYSGDNDRARAADETARAAREVIAKRLGVVRSA